MEINESRPPDPATSTRISVSRTVLLFFGMNENIQILRPTTSRSKKFQKVLPGSISCSHSMKEEMSFMAHLQGSMIIGWLQIRYSSGWQLPTSVPTLTYAQSHYRHVVFGVIWSIVLSDPFDGRRWPLNLCNHRLIELHYHISFC